MPSSILYTESNPVTQTTTNPNFVDITGLTLTLPPGSANGEQALIILDVPNPYALGNDYPGAYFRLKAGSGYLNPIACFTYSIQQLPVIAGRMPTTLVARVKLGTAPMVVQAQWQSVRNSKVIVDSPCSISAILGF